ncbi:MAG: metallophosphoesterase [Proteobacteria bacterium]|nr:metallophosphoesterase [Pseudomonadota bacterium]
MPHRVGMTSWYNPGRLVSIAIRVAISTIFGEFVDRREAMAAAREIDPDAIDKNYDYSANDELWFDFMADTGDGWNPAYAMARLLAEPVLAVPDTVSAEHHELPRGRLLILGGDEVYPTASREDYDTKLVAPLKEAASHVTWPNPPPDLYALPGNHDWYDGLSAFVGLFCARRIGGPLSPPRNGRSIGGRLTQQTRSYFALKLPGGWWLWGIDAQLTSYIDQSQVDFFATVAKEWMPERSKVIMCAAQPYWAYAKSNPDAATHFTNFAYMENLLDTAEKSHELRLVLTGDSHHYARFTETNAAEREVHYITAGGGGAFLHPTHQLHDTDFESDMPLPGTPRPIPDTKKYKRSFKLAADSRTRKPSVFPSAKTSRRLAWRNLAFAIYNPVYTLSVGAACIFFAWLLHANARLYGIDLPTALGRPETGYIAALCCYFRLVIATPWPLLLAAAVAGGYYYLADFYPNWRRALAGGLHALLQMGAVVSVTPLLGWLVQPAPPAWRTVLLIASIGAAGGILGAKLLGVYFLFCLNVFGVHWNEAFSSLRIADYKNFLRLHIDCSGKLTVYPVGLAKVPTDDAADGTTKPRLTPHMIEKPIPLC